MVKNSYLPDFIISICCDKVECFTGLEEVFTSPIANFENQDFETSLNHSIRDVIIKAENFLLKNLECGVLLTNIPEIKKTTIKILNFEYSKVNKIKEDFEAKTGRKVLSLKHFGMEEGYTSIQVLSYSKAVLEVGSEILNKSEVEVLEAKTMMHFLSNKVFSEEKFSNFVLVKFNEYFCEIANVKNGVLSDYEVDEEFSFINILQNLSNALNLEIEDVFILAKHYRILPKLERMQKYYARENHDSHLKSFIEDTNKILLLTNEIKNQVLFLKNKIKLNFELMEDVPFYFFYETKFQDIPLHQFLNRDEKNFQIDGLEHLIKKKENVKIPLFKSFSTQVKKIFHLSS
jgi:hypothetical protein